MSAILLIFRSLAHHWRIHVAVALGVAAATAVLTGALLVGDSVRGSLRALLLDRLGTIDEVVLADRFFRAELAHELRENTGFQKHYRDAVGAILLQGTVERNFSPRNEDGTRQTVRATGVTVIGCDERFWELGGGRPQALPGRNQIVLNQPLADELGANVGDQLVLRLPKTNQVPDETPFGRKSGTLRNLARLQIVDIIPARGLGRFGLRPTQQLPRNAYLESTVLQDALDQTDRVNMILVSGPIPHIPPGTDASAALAKALHPTLDDYGFSLRRVRRTFRDPDSGKTDVVYDYYNFTTNRMLLSEFADAAAENAWAYDHAQPALTYLANSIAKGGDSDHPIEIPYSTVTAIDSVAGTGPLVTDTGEPLDPLREDEIVLNGWAAQRLDAVPGDEIQVTFFEPESTHGTVRERTESFTLKAIIPITEPSGPYTRDEPAVFDRRPTRANDPDLTPVVEGLTDRESLDDWDAPFPFDYHRVRSEDETYWDNHRTTPKAFVSLATGRRLWSSERFGQTTSYRIPAREDLAVKTLAGKLLDQFDRDGLRPGFQLVPIKRHGLEASAGTTPFSVLFLGFSFFLIAAALMLVGLLFRLGLEQRAPEIGVLFAVGMRHRLVVRILTAESLVVALLGGVSGTLIGVAYAWLMLGGLRTWWLDAVVTPFLTLHCTTGSLMIGCASGVFVCALTILWSIWAIRSIPVRSLLTGRTGESMVTAGRGPQYAIYLAWLMFAVAIALMTLATQLGGEAQAGTFFGCGASVLAGILLLVWAAMWSAGFSGLRGLLLWSGDSAKGTDRLVVANRLTLSRLAARNAGRNPGRSTLIIGLVASASFLIVAISAFRLDPAREGAGGFDLVAESDRPIHYDLNTESGRKSLNFLGEEAAEMDEATILSFRVQPGDDASCLNLYQPRQPRLLGVPRELVQYYQDPPNPGFTWADSAAGNAAQHSNPWLLLDKAQTDGTIPVVLDKNTAMFSLHLYGGVGQEFKLEDERGNLVGLRIVGLLSNSIFQGHLLVGEADFVKLFPSAGGYRMFLIRSATQGASHRVQSILESRLGDMGFDATSTQARLENLLAVQNTYLSTFQSLGALGLLLGTFGLAAVQLRNVLERRGELALLRAAGYRRARLVRLVILENAVLLIGGLATGVLAAAVAVFPHWLAGGASIPVDWLAATLGIVLVVGLSAGYVAVRVALNARLIPALRGD